MHVEAVLFVVNLFGIACIEFVSNNNLDPSVQIRLPLGMIQGRFKHAADIGMPYYSYEGIPYAKPPVGALRFKPPQLPNKWNGMLDASRPPPSCIQIPSSRRARPESEDCLYINVYTPIHMQSQTPNTPLPVMVWLYGGGFLFGTARSSYFGPDYLLDANVIVVHFNYRLNVFGFLSTNDMRSPGNYGLKDQVMALEWVRDNIRHFGGDSNRTTIFGESAGGVSVQYHLLSPSSRNLFQAAISESGSVLCPWALQRHPAKIAFQVGLASGMVTADSGELLKHLTALNVDKLKRAVLRVIVMNTININSGLPFTPVLEPEHYGAFITRRSYDLLLSGNFEKVPYIIGFNSQESASAQPVLEFWEGLLALWNTNPAYLVPSGMNIGDLQLMHAVGEQIKGHYFTSRGRKSGQYLDFISDSYFYRPILESAKLYAAHSPTFLYLFSYEGVFLGRRAMEVTDAQSINGVMHSEEVWYLFARSDLFYANASDKLMRQRMVRLWTNFAKFGNPTPYEDPLLQNVSWPAINSTQNVPFLDINNQTLVRYNYKETTMKFWKDLFDKYGNPPYYTF